MKWRAAGFLVLFMLLHAPLTLMLVIGGFRHDASMLLKVSAVVFALPILLPLMMLDPDGERFPGWFRMLSIPLNSLAAGLALWMSILGMRRLLRRRRRPGLCAGCGYDLRATPDRCPECGRPTVATTVPADAKA